MTYIVTAEGVAFMDKRIWLNHVVLGVGSTLKEAEEVIVKYATNTMRSKFEETEIRKNSENQTVHIWEDEHGEEKFVITEL